MLYVGMARICAEMRRTLKASKLHECENISLFRHFIMCCVGVVYGSQVDKTCKTCTSVYDVDLLYCISF